MHRISKFDLTEQYVEYTDPRIIEIIKEKVKEYNDLETALSRPTGDTESDWYKKTSKKARDKYLEILYSNPAGFKLTARMTTNYRELKTVYFQRRNHRLPEWRAFCKWIETLPMAELIIGEKK